MPALRNVSAGVSAATGIILTSVLSLAQQNFNIKKVVARAGAIFRARQGSACVVRWESHRESLRWNRRVSDGRKGFAPARACRQRQGCPLSLGAAMDDLR